MHVYVGIASTGGMCDVVQCVLKILIDMTDMNSGLTLLAMYHGTNTLHDLHAL